jgi:L,D-peptidoglycan transpeptidase YkuD (ErfK/YbiS/YcfS/YnhG family)
MNKAWRALRVPTIVVSTVTSTIILIGLISPASTQATPAALNEITDSKQVVLVSANSWQSTVGTVQVFERDKNSWLATQKPVQAILGYGGLVPGNNRKQGTGKTPTGTYAFTSAFGIKSDPGTKLNYVKVGKNDAWTYNPKFPSTYNIFQTANKDWSSYGNYVEILSTYRKQYNYVAVVDFNLPPGKITQGANGINRTDQSANTGQGGGIFLHVSNGTKTAGCVAIPEKAMKAILEWIDPDKNPVIVIQVES